MTTLRQFLGERIDEDEAVARAATPGPWEWEPPAEYDWPTGDESLVSTVVPVGEKYAPTVLWGWGYDASGIHGSDEDRSHIARWHPARIIAECEARRQVIDGVAGLGYDVAIYRRLALPYADHPDYLEEWKP